MDAALGRARGRWTIVGLSTPAALRTAAVVTALTIGVFGVLTARTVIERRAAATDVVSEAAPQLLDAQNLYVALADADAASSTIYLRAGLEPSDVRRRYLDDVSRGGELLTSITDANLRPEAAGAAKTIARELPEYTRLVEAARTNSRLEHPVGAAYLRRASDLMRTTILPAARTLYQDAALELDDRYTSGTSRRAIWIVVASAGVVVLMLVATQVYVTRRSRRWLNVGLIVAAAVVLAAATAAVLVLQRQENALAESRDDGADLVSTLSTARILTLWSLSDENLDLIERGTVQEYRDDFDLRIGSIGIGEADGLLDRATAAAPDDATREALAALGDRYEPYLAAHDEVRRLNEQYDYKRAVDVAVGSEANAALAVDAELGTVIDGSSETLRREADRARDLARALPIIVILASAAAAVATVAGLRPRLREYR